MTTTQYLLNGALLCWVLGANLGTRRLTRGRLLAPVVAAVVVGVVLLRDLPTLGNDGRLELVGLAAGAGLGTLAAVLVRLRTTPAAEHVVATAGAGFAALWVAVIGGRVAFAYGADHWFPADIGRFSRDHLITGADAWTAAFVLMALAMVVTRQLVTAAQAARVRRAAFALVA